MLGEQVSPRVCCTSRPLKGLKPTAIPAKSNPEGVFVYHYSICKRNEKKRIKPNGTVRQSSSQVDVSQRQSESDSLQPRCLAVGVSGWSSDKVQSTEYLARHSTTFNYSIPPLRRLGGRSCPGGRQGGHRSGWQHCLPASLRNIDTQPCLPLSTIPPSARALGCSRKPRRETSLVWSQFVSTALPGSARRPYKTDAYQKWCRCVTIRRQEH